MIKHFFPCVISNWKYHEEASFSLYFLFAQVRSHAKGAIESKGRQDPGVLMQAAKKGRLNYFFLPLTPPIPYFLLLKQPNLVWK